MRSLITEFARLSERCLQVGASEVEELRAANQRLLEDNQNLEQGRDLMAGQFGEVQKQAQTQLMQLEKQVQVRSLAC